MSSLVLTVTGDLMFYGALAEQMCRSGDMLWGFGAVASALKQGNLLFGNFETPISAARRNEPDAPALYFGPPGVGKAIKQLGYDVVNLAHNHIYDFGAEGVEATMSELTEAGLPFIGIGRTPDEAARPTIVTARGGQGIGFLGYTTASNALDPKHAYVACFPHVERVVADVQALCPLADAVVVSCHMGSQYNPYPAPEARAIARAAIEAGASVFLGHHPHVPQGWERIGTGMAIYSLGDFVAPVHTPQTRRTFFARLTLNGSDVAALEMTPCYITDDCRTVPAEGRLAEEIAEHLRQISADIADGRSDDLHFQIASSRLRSQYISSWIDELRFGGPKVIIRKLRNLRPYHLQLLWRILRDRLPGKKGKPVT